jgi:hypothetical protein
VTEFLVPAPLVLGCEALIAVTIAADHLRDLLKKAPDRRPGPVVVASRLAPVFEGPAEPRMSAVRHTWRSPGTPAGKSPARRTIAHTSPGRAARPSVGRGGPEIESRTAAAAGQVRDRPRLAAVPTGRRGRVRRRRGR